MDEVRTVAHVNARDLLWAALLLAGWGIGMLVAFGVGLLAVAEVMTWGGV